MMYGLSILLPEKLKLVVDILRLELSSASLIIISNIISEVYVSRILNELYRARSSLSLAD